MIDNQLHLVRLCFLSLLCFHTVISARGWGRKVGNIREKEEKDMVEETKDGEGTYNPKNAWMFVDSRRRVLPDIDVEAHFASVENHILSDIHSYHMVGQQMTQSEEEDDIAENNWEEEHSDQYVISRFAPDRSSWRSDDDYWWDKQDEAEARVGVGQSEDYLDSETEGDSSYAETVNTVQSVEVADRQFTTVGLPFPSQATTGWAQTVVNGSAVALLAFLFLLNLTQDVIAQITGRRKRRKKREDGGGEYEDEIG